MKRMKEYIMLFLGIDGGGTKTEMVLCDENAQILSRVKKESASHWQVSEDIIKAVIQDGVDEALELAKKTMSELSAVGYGMSGLGEDLNKDSISIGVCKSVFEGIPLAIKNDGEIGLIASLGNEVGINVVAGTGSIAFGSDSKGTIARCGGWGHELGDEGSGYWLGLKLLELFSKQADGRLEKTLLYDLLRERLQFKYDFELMTIVQDHYFGDRTQIATLQQILCDAAKENDACAIAAYKEAAEELIDLVVGVRNQLEFKGNISVSYSGGVFNAGDFIREPFLNGLKERGFVCCKPVFEPIQGALILAAKQVGYHQELISKLDRIN
jgi:N-acetylglucosamine kinase-like BadF-type ATPase